MTTRRGPGGASHLRAHRSSRGTTTCGSSRTSRRTRSTDVLNARFSDSRRPARNDSQDVGRTAGGRRASRSMRAVVGREAGGGSRARALNRACYECAATYGRIYSSWCPAPGSARARDPPPASRPARTLLARMRACGVRRAAGIQCAASAEREVIFCRRYVSMNPSRSPSRTASVLPVSWLVRWSFTMR